MPPSGPAREKLSRNNLSKHQRHRLIEELLAGSQQGRLEHGAIKKAASTFASPSGFHHCCVVFGGAAAAVTVLVCPRRGAGSVVVRG